MNKRGLYPITLSHIRYNERDTDYHVKPHTSSTHQFYGVLYGTVCTVIDGESHLLNPGQVIVTPPGAIRSPRCRDRAPGYLWANFHNHDLRLGRIERQVLTLSPSSRAVFEKLVNEAQHAPEAHTRDMMLALLLELLIGLIREQKRITPQEHTVLNEGYHEEIVERIELFMKRNLHRSLSRNELAAVGAISGSQLARVFQHVRGMSPLTRLTELRVQHAKELLLETSAAISDICYEVGYHSFSHFAKVFRKHVGVTPSDYRHSGGHVYRAD